MLSTEFGMVTLTSASQSLNAPSSMLVTESGSTILLRPHPENIKRLMLVTEFGIVTLVREVQS